VANLSLIIRFAVKFILPEVQLANLGALGHPSRSVKGSGTQLDGAELGPDTQLSTITKTMAVRSNQAAS
jgi:hypothetical protein